MGVFTTRCTLNLLASATILAAPAVRLALSPKFNVLALLSQQDPDQI